VIGSLERNLPADVAKADVGVAGDVEIGLQGFGVVGHAVPETPDLERRQAQQRGAEAGP
jgi:hypothetical protein